jgi:FKBP-type peptidyl-prolyl cis-trans isomerase
MGNYSMIKGFEEAMMGQREGADVRVLIPSWASGYDYEGSVATNSSPVVYDVEVVSVIDDYDSYEIDTLERFSAANYNGLDSLAEGFYFSSIEDGDGDSVKVGDRISYNYVGRLLNGFVFDTNIEDTARKYRIYNDQSDYEPVSYEVAEVGMTNSSGESVVDGFSKALLNMKSGGKAVTFFSSVWGYGAQRQDFGLKQQLFFYIEVVNEEEE